MDNLIEKNQPIMDWLYQTVQGMVDDPDAVLLKTECSPTQTSFSLRVAIPDIGKVIGKNGRTARSLRTLLHAIGMKQGVRCQLAIEEILPLTASIPAGALEAGKTFGVHVTGSILPLDTANSQLFGSLKGANVRPLEGQPFSGVIAIPRSFVRREGESDNEYAERYLDSTTEEDAGETNVDILKHRAECPITHGLSKRCNCGGVPSGIKIPVEGKVS